MSQFTGQQKVLLAIATFFVLFLLGNFVYQRIVYEHVQHRINQHCDIHQGPCSMMIGDRGSIQLSITPKNIPRSQTLHFKVTLTKFQPKQVRLDVLNINIPSCHQILVLKQQGNQQYVADLTLPTCPNPVHNWLAMVMVENQTDTITVPFHFSSQP